MIPGTDAGFKDVVWLRPDGGEMSHADWAQSQNRVLGMLIHGGASDEVDERGRPNRGQTLLLVLNAGNRARPLTLPELPEEGHWREMINTAAQEPAQRVPKAKTINLHPHSLLLLCYEVS